MAKLFGAIAALFILVIVGYTQDSPTTCYDMIPETQDRTDQWCIVTGPTYTPIVAEFPLDTPTLVLTNTLIPTNTFTSVPTNTPTNTPIATNTQAPSWLGATPTRTKMPGKQTRIVSSGGSIQSAINASAIGDIVSIHAGTYHESLTINTSNITLMAFGDGEVLIDGQCAAANYYGIRVNANYASIYGLHIDRVMTSIHIDGDNGAKPIGTIVENNTLTNFNCNGTGDSLNAGVTSYYAGDHQRVVNNYIQRRSDGSVGAGDGIYFKSSTAKPSNGFHYIAGNTIIGTWDGIGGEVENDSRGTFDRNSVIENNTITLCGDDGIQVEGGGQNVFVQYNTIRQCGSGVAAATVLSGPLYIANNNIFSDIIGTLGGSMCFKVGNSSPAIVNITGNICNVPLGDGIQQTNSGTSSFVVSNNLFNVGRYIFEYTYDIPIGTFNNDCMYTTDLTGRFVKWNNIVYSSLTAFQVASGQELSARIGPC